MSSARLFADGASSGNPGISGIGFYLEHLGKTHEGSECIGHATNNIAEYTALIRGLETACAHGARKIEIFMDSELVVKQIRGQYKVKNEGLKPLHEKAKGLLRKFDAFKISHIPREENKKADALSKKAIKEAPEEKPAQEDSGSGNLRLF